MWNTVSEIGTHIYLAEHWLVASNSSREKVVCIDLEYVFYNYKGLFEVTIAKKYKYKRLVPLNMLLEMWLEDYFE